MVAGDEMSTVSKINWESKGVRITMVLVVMFLFLTPLLYGYYIIYVNPPLANGEYGGEDTFVSSIDSGAHSAESHIRISNYTEGGNETIEIGLFEFDYTPWPGGGSLVEVEFDFTCNEVISGGSIQFHSIDVEGVWSYSVSDFDNLTYVNMPSYHSTPFTSVEITTNGTYVISLLVLGGPFETLYARVLGIAITAEQGTQIVLDSFEVPAVSDRPRMIVYMTIGIMVMNPWIYYLTPLSIVMVFTAIVLSMFLYYKIRNPKTT